MTAATIDEYRARFDALTLASGGHTSPEEGMCALEAVAYVMREPFSDHPACVSPVIAAAGRSWNDALRSDEERARILRPLLPLMVGTNTGPADDETRAWLATDWLVRVCAPAWLDLAKLSDHAAKLRALPPLTSAEIARGVQDAIESARADAAAARDAARDAAWAAARDAAWAAAWAAARDAARDAAWAAARDAAWAAAGAAAGAALEPTVAELQRSFADCMRAMCAVGRVEIAAT